MFRAALPHETPPQKFHLIFIVLNERHPIPGVSEMGRLPKSILVARAGLDPATNGL